jgi:hypothetical protein
MSMNRASILAASPNGMFGILCALELGRDMDALADRAGVSTDALSDLVRRARDGDLRRAGASKGDTGERTVTAPESLSIPDRKPEAVAPRPIREEPKMTELQPPGIGARPRLEWVNVELIDVDKTYQRDADRKSVQKILLDFRWDHFGAVVLSAKPDGRFNCTDGQHRVLAALDHPEVSEVPALITALDGAAAEADNFLTINRSRRAVSTIEIFWAGLASGDAATIRVRDALAAADCGVIRSQAAYQVGMTGAVSAVSRSLERYGDAATIAACKAIRAAWPVDAKSLRGSLITALARIFKGNDRIDRERLIRILASKTYPDLTSGAEMFRKLSGGSTDTVLARTICELYNKGLSTNTILIGEGA